MSYYRPVAVGVVNDVITVCSHHVSGQLSKVSMGN